MTYFVERETEKTILKEPLLDAPFSTGTKNSVFTANGHEVKIPTLRSSCGPSPELLHLELQSHSRCRCHSHAETVLSTWDWERGKSREATVETCVTRHTDIRASPLQRPWGQPRALCWQQTQRASPQLDCRQPSPALNNLVTSFSKENVT